MHLKKTLKIFSTIWTAFFAFSQVAAAIPSLPSAVEFNRTSEAVSDIPQNLLFSLNQLPYELGSLSQIELAETSDTAQSPFIIHLQDAHANPEAQARIQDILRWISTKVNASAKPRPMIVALEGMAGPIHPEYLALVPEFPVANEALVKDLHEKGELSGAELFAWERFRKNEARENKMDVSFFGAEDPQRYRENMKSYRRLLFLQNDVEEALAPLRKNLEVIQSRLLNSELRDFLKEREQRKHHFVPYVSRQLTDKTLEILGIDLNDRLEQIRFPNLTRFLYIQQIERNLNRQNASADWERLKGELENRKIRKDWIEALDGFMGQGHKNETHFRQVLESVLRSLQDKKIPFEQYPHCVLWIGHTLLSGEINAADLFQEVEVLEQAIQQKLIKSGDEKVYLEFYRQFLLFEKALHLELSRDEFEELLLIRNQMDPKMLKERLNSLNRLLGEKKSEQKWIAGQWLRSFRASIPGHSLSSFDRLSDLLNQVLVFYLDARRRDQGLVENTLSFAGRKSSGEPPVIVLIAGGFHTQGITRLISERKIPHAVISPRMTKLEQGDLYHKVLRGENADISRYLKDASLNKQESLFLKGLLEQVMPVLAQKYGVGSKDLPARMESAIHRHPVLGRHIQAKVFPRAQQPFVRLNIESDRTLHPVASKAISEILLTGSAESYFLLYDLPVSQPLSGTHISPSFNISFPDVRGRAKVEKIENQAARIKNLAVRTGPLRRGVGGMELRSPQESEGNPLLVADESGRTGRSELRVDSPVNVGQSEKIFHEQRGRLLVSYANQNGGKLPVPTHPIDHFARFKDLHLNLMFLSREERLRYWLKAFGYFKSLQQKAGRITIGVMAGGAASRMNKHPLPKYLIRALQEDPELFVDRTKLTKEEIRKIHDDFHGNLKDYFLSLDPDNDPQQLELFDRVLYGPKALLPAGSVDGKWYNLLGYALINVRKANDELESMELGRPFIAEVMLNDDYYPMIVRHLIDKKFYGLKVKTLNDNQGHAVDIDHDELSNEVMIYNQQLSYRKVAPVSTVKMLWENDRKANKEAGAKAKKEVDLERKNQIITRAKESATFKSRAAYRHALEYSQENEGKVIYDRALVPGGHGDRFHARLETTSRGRKAPIFLDTLLRNVEYDFFHNIDNMAAVNDDWMAIFGYMLTSNLAIVFEGSSRPATERGGGGGFDWAPINQPNGSSVLRLRQTEDIITQTSLLGMDSETGKSLSPNYYREREDIAAAQAVREILPNQVPVNNASEYDRMPSRAEEVLKGRDVLSANLPAESRQDFHEALKKALEMRKKMLQNKKESFNFSNLKTFANALRQKFGLVATPKLIKDPFVTHPKEHHQILTVVDETFAWSSQEGFLAEGLVDVVGTPSINDVKERGIHPEDVRFDPLKDRPTYDNDDAQDIREALLKRVVKGKLFSSRIEEISEIWKMFEENRAKDVKHLYFEASRISDRDRAKFIKDLMDAFLDISPENSEIYKRAYQVREEILRHMLVVENRAWEVRLDYYKLLQNKDPQSTQRIKEWIVQFIREKHDDRNSNLFRSSEWVLGEIEKAESVKEKMSVGDHHYAFEVLEIYRQYHDSGDEAGTRFIREWVFSLLREEPPHSDVHKSAAHTAIEITKLEGRRSELRSGKDQEGQPAESREISGDVLNEINRLNPELANQLSGYFDLETVSTQGNYASFRSKHPLILESPDGSKFRFDLNGEQKPGGTLVTIETYDLSGSRKDRDAYFDFRMMGDAAYADFKEDSSAYTGYDNAIAAEPDQKERNLGSILVTLGLYWTKLHGAKRFNLAYVETPRFFEKIGFIRKESPVLGTEYMFDLEKGSLPALRSISLPDAGAGEVKRVLEKAALKPEILRHPQAREQALHAYNAGVGGLIPIVKGANKKELEVIPYEISSAVDSKSQTAYLRHLASGERLFVIFAAGRSTRMNMPVEFDRLGIAGLNPAILKNLPLKRVSSQEDFAQAKLLIDDAARGNIKTLEDLSFIQRQFLQLGYQLERLVESNPQSGLKLQDVLKGISFLVIVNPANRNAIAKQLSAVSFAGLDPARVLLFEQQDKGGVEILTDGTTRPYSDKKWPRGHGEPFLSMKNKTGGGYWLNAQGVVEEIKGDRLTHVLRGIGVKRAFVMKVNDLPLLEDMALLERWAASSRLMEEGASMVVELVDNKIGQEAGGAFRRGGKYILLRDSIAMKDPALSSLSIPETSSRLLYDMDWDQYTRQTVLPLLPYLMERVTPEGKAVLTLEYKSGDLTGLFNTLAIKQPGFELRTFKDRSRIPIALAAMEKQNAQPGFSEMAENLILRPGRSEVRNEEESQWDLENDLPELFWGEKLNELRQKFEYFDDNARGKKIPPDRQEVAFSIRVAANYSPPSQRKRFDDFHEALAGAVKHNRLKLYLPDFERLRIALVGRYSDSSGVDLLQKSEIEQVLGTALEKIKQNNIENFSIQVQNVELKKDGSIVLNLIPSPAIARLRYLLHDAFVEALEEKWKRSLLGVEKQQFRLPEDPDAGVITIGRIVPKPSGIGPVINADDLREIKAAISWINWSLAYEPLYIEADQVSLIRPAREFLEKLAAAQEGYIRLMKHKEMDASNAKVQGIFSRIRQIITADGTEDFRQSFSSVSQDMLKALKSRLANQAQAWELGLEDENVPEWKRLFWSWQVHSILWLINDQFLKQPDAVDQAQDEDRKAIQLLAKAREVSFIQSGRIPPFKISEDPRELYQRVIDWIRSPLGQGIKIQSFVKLPPNTGYEGSAILASSLMQAILALINDPQAPSVTVTSGLRVQTSSAGGSDMFGWAIRNGMTMVHGTFYINDQPPVVVRVERLPVKALIFESIDLNKREEISETQAEFTLPRNGDVLKHLKAALALSVSFSKDDIAALMGSPDRKRKMAFLGSVLEGLPQVGVYGGVNNLAATVGGGFVYTSNQPGDYDPKPVTIANAKQLRQFQAHSRLFNPGIRKQVKGDVSTAGRQIKRALLVGTNQKATLQFMHELGGDTRNMPGMIRRGDFNELAHSINNVQIWTDKIIGNATRKALPNGEPVSLQVLHAFLDDVTNEYGRRTKTPLGVLVQGAGPIGGVLFVGEKMNILDNILKKKLPEFERTLKHSEIFDEANRPALIPFDITDRPLTAYTQLSLQTLDAKKASSMLRHPDGFRNYIRLKLREQNLALVNGKDLSDQFLQWYKASFKKANGTDRKLSIEILKNGKEVLLRLDDAGQKSLGHVLYSPVRDYQQLSERSEIRIALPKVQASIDPFTYESTLELQERIAAIHLPAPYSALDLEDIQRNYPEFDAKWKTASQFTGSFFQPQILKMSEPMTIRMIQLVFAGAGQTGLSKKQIQQVARKVLGEYAWLLDPKPAPIHLIQPLGEGPVKAEDYISLYLLGIVNRKDRVTLILPHADAQKALTVKTQFDAEAGKLGMSDFAGRLSVVASSGAGEADVIRVIKQAATKSGNYSLGTLHESTEFLKELGYIGMSRVHNAGRLNQNTAVMITAALLREQLANDYQIVNLESWMREHGVRAQTLINRVSRMIEALKHLASQA